jgi:hypothetical protein
VGELKFIIGLATLIEHSCWSIFIYLCCWYLLDFICSQNLTLKGFEKKKIEKKKGEERPDSAWWPAGREAQPAQFFPLALFFPPPAFFRPVSAARLAAWHRRCALASPSPSYGSLTSGPRTSAGFLSSSRRHRPGLRQGGQPIPVSSGFLPSAWDRAL